MPSLVDRTAQAPLEVETENVNETLGASTQPTQPEESYKFGGFGGHFDADPGSYVFLYPLCCTVDRSRRVHNVL